MAESLARDKTLMDDRRSSICLRRGIRTGLSENTSRFKSNSLSEKQSSSISSILKEVCCPPLINKMMFTVCRPFLLLLGFNQRDCNGVICRSFGIINSSAAWNKVRKMQAEQLKRRFRNNRGPLVRCYYWYRMIVLYCNLCLCCCCSCC